MEEPVIRQTCGSLSSNLTLLICLLMSSLYVGSLYFLPKSIRVKSRDAPIQIIARSCTVLTSSITCVGCLWWFSGSSCGNWLWLLGIRTQGFIEAIIWPLLLISLLYCGPIVTTLLLAQVKMTKEIVWTKEGAYVAQTPLSSTRRNISFLTALGYVLGERIKSETKFTIFRNLFVGPVFEEVVFRGCMLPLLLCSGFSMMQCIFIGPLIFGVAHIHHLIERNNKGMALPKNMVITVVQFTYTYLFGVFSAFLFLRTGHLVAPMVCHMFCNYWQLPDLGFLEPREDPLSPLYRYRHILLAVYSLGILAFVAGLDPLTSNRLFQTFQFRWPCGAV